MTAPSVVALLARRGVRAHLGRVVITALSIVVGVAFTSGSLILTDSFRSSFDRLVADLDRGIDLRVRGATAFGRGGGGDPVPAELVEQIRDVPGVRRVEPDVDATVVLLDANGDPVPARRIQLGVSWSGSSDIGGRVLVDGRPPDGPDEAALDATTAARVGLRLGERISVATPLGVREFSLVGTTGLVSNPTNSFGATIVAFDPITAQEVLDSPGRYDSIDVALDAGADPVTVRTAIGALLPDGAEVVDGSVIRSESAQRVENIVATVRWVLVGFAVIALFVSALLIDNTFRIITAQRLRELALLRAIGASVRQVRRMVLGEAAVVAVVATAVGFVAGIGVSRLLVVIFNAAGAGFPKVATVIEPRSVIGAFVVGVGITLGSVGVPALRAGRTPPLAATTTDPRSGTAAERRASRIRLVAGTATVVVGMVVFCWGVFRPNPDRGRLVATAAIGGFGVLVGTALAAAGVAPTVGRVVGLPVARLGRIPGRLGAANAIRSPRRTASAASALMIGLALVSGVAVVGASLSRGLADRLEGAITADFVVRPAGSRGIPPTLADELAELPEVAAASGFRTGEFEVEGTSRPLAAIDGEALVDLVDLTIVEGSASGLAARPGGLAGVLVQRRPAADLGLVPGDIIDVRWRNGGTAQLEVRGIYADSVAVNANWVVDLDTFAAANPASTFDLFAIVRIDDAVDAERASDALDAALVDFPQVEVQDQIEFRRAQEQQLDQLLVLIYSLLGFSAAIAVLGITNTLSLSVLERTQEIGLIRAVGATRRQVRVAVIWEAVIVAVFGAVLGVVVGLVLGGTAAGAMDPVGVRVVVWPFATIVVVVVAAMTAGLVAAAWPARRAARMAVLAAIARP